MTLNLGTESSLGRFTKDSLLDTNTDSSFVAVANIVSAGAGSKVIL